MNWIVHVMFVVGILLLGWVNYRSWSRKSWENDYERTAKLPFFIPEALLARWFGKSGYILFTKVAMGAVLIGLIYMYVDLLAYYYW